MSWSTRIIIFLVFFVIGMMSLVYIASKQSNDLIYENYYDKEISFNKIISARSNFNATGEEITFVKDSSSQCISVPQHLLNKLDSGTIEFIKHDNKQSDFKIDMATSSDGKYYISKNMSPGHYMVKISWSNNSIPYFFENNNYTFN